MKAGHEKEQRLKYYGEITEFARSYSLHSNNAGTSGMITLQLGTGTNFVDSDIPMNLPEELTVLCHMQSHICDNSEDERSA